MYRLRRELFSHSHLLPLAILLFISYFLLLIFFSSLFSGRYAIDGT